MDLKDELLRISTIAERAKSRKPLRDILESRDRKGEEIWQRFSADPASLENRMLVGALDEQSFSDLARKIRTAGNGEKERMLGVMTEELWHKGYKRNSELVFIADFGSEENGLRAVEELARHGAVYELLAVALASYNDTIAAAAVESIKRSPQFVDTVAEAVSLYNDCGYTGFFREFLGDGAVLGSIDKQTRNCLIFVNKLILTSDLASAEYQSNAGALDFLSSAAKAAMACGREGEAREIIDAVFGKAHVGRLAKKLEERESITFEAMLAALDEDRSGQTLKKNLEEWILKDDLLDEKYSHLHQAMGENMFLIDSVEECLMMLLPQELRERIGEEAGKDLDILLSPILSEKEKEKGTGMNERMARVSLNLGVIRNPLPSPFGNPKMFERHVSRIVNVLRHEYSDEEIAAFLGKRIVTAVMENTKFQNGVAEASCVLRAISGEHERIGDEVGALEAKVANEAIGVLRGYIDFHTRHQEANGLDFYQSIRIRAFLDHRRILVADGTGTGKTIVALGCKQVLDSELAGRKRRGTILVLAPSTGTFASWGQEKMDEYCSKFGFPSQKVFIVKDRKDLEDFGRKVKENDIIIVGYGKLKTPEDNPYLKSILGCDFDAVIIDECHNIKNFDSDRGMCARRIIRRFGDERLLLLSATPLPNTINDGIGMLLYALDPEKHADAENYKYNNDPEQVRHLWMGQRWFRRTLEDIRMSRVEKEDFVEIELHREEAEAYFNLWKECAYTGFKLSKLQRMLIDEEYSAKVGAGRLAKLEKLDSIVAEAAVKGQKVVIWTPWVSGVIDGLQDRYGEHGAVKIDGRTESAVQRYRIAKAFKSSPLVNVMIISKVADEAIDLSCGDKGVVLVRLVPPITPREDIQTIGRVNRRTQAGLVRVLTLVGKSELLKGRMQAFASEELSELGLSPPSYFLAQTIDKDVELLLKWKRAITEKVFRGEKLSQNEMSRWGVTTIAQAKHYLNSSLYSSTKDTPPFIRAIFIDQNLRNAGAEDVAKAMDGKIGRAYAKLYEEGWESSHSQHTLRLIKRLMEPGMTDGQAPKVIDLGGAAGYSSRVLGIGTTIVDLNPHFIKKGEEICSSLGIRNRFVRGDMRNTGEAEGSYDVAIASYSLHHLKQTEEERQVEETLLEMNRILKEDGRVFIAFPWSAGEDSLQRFAKGLPLYGFMVTGSSGVYYPVFDDDKRGKKILLLEARKVAEARGLSPKVNWNSFIVYSEQSRMGFASDREKKERVKKKDNEKKRLRDFRKVRGIIT